MSKKILIIEDEESIADLEKDYLELSDFEVAVANDGEIGRRKALEEDYDLIILDLMLPGVDGFEICRQVRDQKNTPIIMVSAKKDDIDKIRGLGLGADDYMVKPFSPKGMRPLRADWQELVDQSISLWEDCPDAGWVTEMLSASATFDERVGIVAEFARRQLADPEYTPDFVEYSELQLCQARGNIRMDSISDYTGYTGRYCREKFKESHGISIKNYSSIMRFQNAVRMLAQSGGEVGSLSDIAFNNGYFDQSHLNREFRRFSGATPLRYQREVLQLT